MAGFTTFASTSDNAKTMLNLSTTAFDDVVTIGCDLHILNLDLNHSIEALAGPKGDMNDIHVIQLVYKISYLCSQNWTEMKGLLKNTINNIIATTTSADGKKSCKEKWKVSSC